MYEGALIYEARLNEFMKEIESVKCNMIHEDLSAVIYGIQFKGAGLIHEHYFVPAKPKVLDEFVVCCITCGNCYCNICGKLLHGFNS